MTISTEEKVQLLHNFHSYLYEPDWRFLESKEKDRQVLEDFPTVVQSYLSPAWPRCAVRQPACSRARGSRQAQGRTCRQLYLVAVGAPVART